MKARAGVQGSPRMLCPALLSCSFQCIRGGWEALLCQEMGQALSLPASFFHPGLCLPGQLSFLSPACVCISENVCVCVRKSAIERGIWKGKAGSMTRCQTFSNFLSTTNLIGSSDALKVKGEHDWMMPAGIEQTVGRTWLGMFGMRQEFPPIGLFRGIIMCMLMRLCCVYVKSTPFKCLICVCVRLRFRMSVLLDWRAEEALDLGGIKGKEERPGERRRKFYLRSPDLGLPRKAGGLSERGGGGMTEREKERNTGN